MLVSFGQANILEELLGSVNMDSKMRETLQILLRKLRSIEVRAFLAAILEIISINLSKNFFVVIILH